MYRQFSRKNSGISRYQPIGAKQCSFDHTLKSLKDILYEYKQKISIKKQEYLNIIYNMYLLESGESLSKKTHNERPWKDTTEQGRIEKRLMADFFSGRPIFDFIKVLQSYANEEYVEQVIGYVHNSLILSSKSQLEEYQNSLEDLRSKVPQKILEKANINFLMFAEQTADQAFLGTFFFPDLLETGFDHSLTYYQHQTIPTRLNVY